MPSNPHEAAREFLQELLPSCANEGGSLNRLSLPTCIVVGRGENSTREIREYFGRLMEDFKAGGKGKTRN